MTHEDLPLSIDIMMIGTAAFLSDFSRRRLDQTRLFLAECNDSGVTYRVTDHPIGLVTEDVSIAYAAEPFEGDTPGSDVWLKTRHGPAVLRTSLFYAAMGLLALLADHPPWMKLMLEIDPAKTGEAAWAAYDLDAQSIFREDLRPVTTGSFIAPHGTGFVQFSIDTHGELSIQAESERLAVLIFRFAAQQAMRNLRVDEKLGTYARRVRSGR